MPTADPHGDGGHSEVSPLFQEEAQGSSVPQILGSAANLRKRKEESPGESLDTLTKYFPCAYPVPGTILAGQRDTQGASSHRVYILLYNRQCADRKSVV